MTRARQEENLSFDAVEEFSIWVKTKHPSSVASSASKGSYKIIYFRNIIMVQYAKEKTNPGTKQETKNYEIIFVAGHQDNVGCYFVEYESNWIQLMRLILASLESEDTFTDISLFLNQELQRYMSPGINVRVEIFNPTYFQMKLTKSLHLSFTDPSKTTLVFLIRRRQVLKSLKDISIQNVTEHIIRSSDVRCLEIPMSLKKDLIAEAQTIWYQDKEEDFHAKKSKTNLSWRLEWRAENLLKELRL